MYVTVSTYRAKIGEEDAIVALHEDWERKWSTKAKAYLSWDLLRNDEAPQEFIMITYFMNKGLAQAAIADLELDAWYGRLMSLLEEGPVQADCTSVWQLRRNAEYSVQASGK